MGVVIMRDMVMIIVLFFLLRQCARVGGVGAVMKE